MKPKLKITISGGKLDEQSQAWANAQANAVEDGYHRILVLEALPAGEEE